MHEMFSHKSFNATSILPKGWKQNISEFALNNAKSRILTPNSITSRESETIKSLEVMTVGGITIKNELAWLYELYKTKFYSLAKRCTKEELFLASDPRYAININLQKGNLRRYECHIDSNPLEGLLYVTSHNQGDGGELIVANNKDALGTEEIKKDCQSIFPKAGNLIFFDARKFPHYVAPLKSKEAFRVVVAMNFYTPSCPESSRPKDLNKHLFGTD
jgi:2OG-Fe(II) oxygenase superfamily